MSVQYQVVIRNQSGETIAALYSIVELRLRKSVNVVGDLSLIVPANELEGVVLSPDFTIQVWRKVDEASSYLEGNTVWFLRSWSYQYNESGLRVIVLEAEDALSLLGRRIVAYPAESAQATETDNADDFMKDVMRENFGSSVTDSARNLSSLITIEADTGSAPSITKAFAYRNILSLFQEIAMASYSAGTYLAFELASNPSVMNGFIFRTRTGQYGTDKRKGKHASVILSPDMDSVAASLLQVNYRDSRNYVYAGGLGEAALRIIGAASNSTSIALSPFHRIETFVDALMADTVAKANTEAAQALREYRDVKLFSGRQVNSRSVRYGVEVFLGDYVTAQVEKQTVDVRLDTVAVSLSNMREDVYLVARSD